MSDDEQQSWVSPVHTAGGGELTAILLSLKDVEKIKESAYRAGREDAARDIDEWADGYESFARGESNTELVVTNLRHAGRIAREGQGVPWIASGQERRP